MSEVWLKVPGYPERFEVSSEGRVRTTAHSYIRDDPRFGVVEVRLPARLLKQTPTKQGYRTVNTGSAGSCDNTPVHVLVALAFVPGFAPGLEVNHIDGVKSNNHFDNLEWVTRSENVAHSHRNLPRKRPSHCVRVRATTPSGEKFEFDSLSAAARHFGVTTRAARTWLDGLFRSRTGVVLTAI